MRQTWISILLFLITSVVQAGVVMRVEMTDHDREEARTTEQLISIEDGVLKIDTELGTDDEPGATVVFRQDRQEILVLDHNSKAYTVFNEAAAEAIAAEFQNAVDQARSRLEAVPEEHRAKVEEVLKEFLSVDEEKAPRKPSFELTRTEESAELRGYPCVKHELHEDGKVISELYLTDWDRVQSGQKVVGALLELEKFTQKLFESLGRMPRADRIIRKMTLNPYRGLDQLDGFPVRTLHYDDSRLTAELVLQSIGVEELDLAALGPPEGYREEKIGRQ